MCRERVVTQKNTKTPVHDARGVRGSPSYKLPVPKTDVPLPSPALVPQGVRRGVSPDVTRGPDDTVSWRLPLELRCLDRGSRGLRSSVVVVCPELRSSGRDREGRGPQPRGRLNPRGPEHRCSEVGDGGGRIRDGTQNRRTIFLLSVT